MIGLLGACSPMALKRASVQATEAVLQGAEPTVELKLPDLGLAPAIEGEIWLNVDGPLQWDELRGRVVLVEMWTFGCINCQRVIPHVREWHARYADHGLVIIGNHYPEFPYERDLGNLKKAVDRLEVSYPVVQDNDRLNWGRYETRYWPTLYLIDKQGKLRYQHIGEGAYALTERAIQVLLAEPAPAG